MTRVARLEMALEAARGYRDAMYLEAERTAAYGGKSHLDRVTAYGQASAECRALGDALTDAYRGEAEARIRGDVA